MVVAAGVAFMAAEVQKPQIGGAIVSGAFLALNLAISEWKVIPSVAVACQYGMLVMGLKEHFLPFALLLVLMLFWPAGGKKPPAPAPAPVKAVATPPSKAAPENPRSPIIDAVTEQRAAIAERERIRGEKLLADARNWK